MPLRVQSRPRWRRICTLWAALLVIATLGLGSTGCGEDTCGQLEQRLCRELNNQCGQVGGFLDKELGELPSAVKRHACREILKTKANVSRWTAKAKSSR